MVLGLYVMYEVALNSSVGFGYSYPTTTLSLNLISQRIGILMEIGWRY